MVKDYSDSEKGNLLPPHGSVFPISSKGSFICIIPDRKIHTTAFVTPVVEHWLERGIAQWVHPMKDRSNDPSHHERTFLPRSYISLLSVYRPERPKLNQSHKKKHQSDEEIYIFFNLILQYRDQHNCLHG